MAGEKEKASIDEGVSTCGDVEDLKIGSPAPARTYTLFSACSFAVSISGLFGTVGISFIYPLLAGGAAAITWCWFIAGVGCLLIAFSVAELVSAYPTSGGLYHVCYHVFPKKISPFMCWCAGWMSLLGQLAITTSSEYGGAQMLLAAASMGSDFKYNPTAQQTVGTVAAILTFHGCVVCLPTKYIEKLTRSFMILHFGSMIAGAVALLIKTNPRHDATYVFTNVEANSGWSPVGWSYLFGFLSVSWSMTLYDGTAHLADVLQKPATTAPWAISIGMLATFILGFLYNIVLAFCMKDPENIMSQTLPISAIYYNSLGKAGGIAFTVLMFVIMNFVGISVLQSTSSTIWAQAKDKMLIGSSQIFSKTNKRTGTPVYAIALATVLCILISLIAIGSSTTINAIFNLTAIALDWCAALPIIGKLLYPHLFVRGPWHLGKLSKAVNIAAVAWTCFVTVLFCMPYSMPVTAENMNYACVFFVFIILASLISWLCGAHKIYKGPMIEEFEEFD